MFGVNELSMVSNVNVRLVWYCRKHLRPSSIYSTGKALKLYLLIGVAHLLLI